MAKGVIYIMTTVVDGLIKIGKTQTNQFETRMQFLESNGYRNITGLKRKFAIEVDGYDEKESLLDNIFERARVHTSELFALNADLAVQLLSSFEGEQIYPKPDIQSKSEVFDEATERVAESKIPNGMYYLERTIKAYNNKTIKAQMEIKDGKYIVLAGSDICPLEDDSISNKMSARRAAANIKDNKLMADENFTASSTAAVFVLGKSENGRTRWKTKDGVPLSAFIQTESSDEE